jgi:hypothetical protein
VQKTSEPAPAPGGREAFAGLAAPAAPRARPGPPRLHRAHRPALARGLLRPLYWANRAFDRGTERLGAPGRWLRSRRGRAALGWAGVVLLAAAAGWQVLAWIGWGW